MTPVVLGFLGIFTMIVAMDARRETDACRFFTIITIVLWGAALWTAIA